MTSATCKDCGNEYEKRNAHDSFCLDCWSKRGRRSKRKGSSNELRFSKYLQSKCERYGLKYRVKRTPRSGGIREFEAADIMVLGTPQWSIFKRLHFENKNTAQWYIPQWIDEAVKKETDSGMARAPLLVIRHPNEHQEYAVMRIEDMVDILIEIEKLTSENEKD